MSAPPSEFGGAAAAAPLRALLLAFVAAFALLGCVSSGPLPSAVIDFAEIDPWSLHVVTEDEDGDERVTRIWIVQWDGAAAIRTGESRWKQNLSRGSRCRLRVDGVDYPVRVDFVTNLALRRRIDEAFQRKYGWQETLVIGGDRAESGDYYLKLTPLAN